LPLEPSALDPGGWRAAGDAAALQVCSGGDRGPGGGALRGRAAERQGGGGGGSVLGGEECTAAYRANPAALLIQHVCLSDISISESRHRVYIYINTFNKYLLINSHSSHTRRSS